MLELVGGFYQVRGRIEGLNVLVASNCEDRFGREDVLGGIDQFSFQADLEIGRLVELCDGLLSKEITSSPAYST